MAGAWINVEDFAFPQGWASIADPGERARSYCSKLERGEILFFQELPFELATEHREFLLAQRQSNSPLHKNISYRPTRDLLRGASGDSPRDLQQALHIMRDYSRAVTDFLARFLVPYANHYTLDYASFRPLEEKGRELPLHKRNDLLHVDAFPSRPTHGDRILRVFTNINNAEPRVWLTSSPFAEMASTWAPKAGLARFAAQSPFAAVKRRARRALVGAGVPIPDRSPYDEFMLHFHDWLKESRDFQEHVTHRRHEFPPGATWLVFTDGVPHAALSGRFALEQTFMISRPALVNPESAPINVLEKLSGKLLAA